MAESVKATFNQILKQGILDVDLGSNPDALLFNYNYKKVPNHAPHVAKVLFHERADFGKTLTADIDNFGDCISNMYLHIKLPPLSIASGSTYTGWTNAVGYTMIESVEFLVGSYSLVKMTGLMMEAMSYISTSTDKRKVLDSFVGRYDTHRVLPVNAVGTKDLYIPLPFWFTQKLSQAFPLFLVTKNSVSVRVKLRPFAELVTYDGPTPPVEIPPLDAWLSVKYIAMDPIEKKQLEAQTEIVYLFEQWQTHVFQEFPPLTTTGQVELNFRNAIKEIVFVLVETASEDNNDWSNFGRRDLNIPGGELLTAVTLYVNSEIRFATMPESYWRQVGPYEAHTSGSDRNIYVLPFAAAPERNQPTGFLDMSTIDNMTLQLDFIPNLPRCRMYALGVSYNKLVIRDGEMDVTYS
jgi:hypothetical protein